MPFEHIIRVRFPYSVQFSMFFRLKLFFEGGDYNNLLSLFNLKFIMTEIEKEFCLFMSKFVNKHKNDIIVSYDFLGYNNSEDMLNKIKTNIACAIWAATELCSWFPKTNTLFQKNGIYTFKDERGNTRNIKINMTKGTVDEISKITIIWNNIKSFILKK